MMKINPEDIVYLKQNNKQMIVRFPHNWRKEEYFLVPVDQKENGRGFYERSLFLTEAQYKSLRRTQKIAAI